MRPRRALRIGAGLMGARWGEGSSHSEDYHAELALAYVWKGQGTHLQPYVGLGPVGRWHRYYHEGQAYINEQTGRAWGAQALLGVRWQLHEERALLVGAGATALYTRTTYDCRQLPPGKGARRVVEDRVRHEGGIAPR